MSGFREHVEEDPGARDAPPPGSAPAPALALVAGNAAAGRLLRARPEVRLMRVGMPAAFGNRATARVLQRYEAYEHAKQGDQTAGSMTVALPLSSGTTSGYVMLSSGQINALADLYATPEDLWNADAVEVENLKVLINKQMADPKSVKESDWDKATGGRYNRLNLRNAPHFGPRNTALVNPGGAADLGQDNRAYFTKYYVQTVVAAQTAYATPIGLPVPGDKQKWLDRAVIVAGFAEHFLMDAFSAGHLFSKGDFITVLKKNLDALSDANRSDMFGAVAKQVLADPKSKALLAEYEPVEGAGFDWGSLGHISIWRPNFDKEFAFKALLEKLYADPEGRQAVYSALVKIVHDALSHHQNADDAIGVTVENDFGRWTLSGDKTLSPSTRTQEMIDKALTHFRRSIEPYRNGPVTGTDPAAEAATIIKAHFPRPTDDTVKLISSLVTSTTDAGAGTTTALVDMLKSELPSILDGLIAHGDIRKA